MLYMKREEELGILIQAKTWQINKYQRVHVRGICEFTLWFWEVISSAPNRTQSQRTEGFIQNKSVCCEEN